MIFKTQDKDDELMPKNIPYKRSSKTRPGNAVIFHFSPTLSLVYTIAIPPKSYSNYLWDFYKNFARNKNLGNRITNFDSL